MKGSGGRPKQVVRAVGVDAMIKSIAAAGVASMRGVAHDPVPDWNPDLHTRYRHGSSGYRAPKWYKGSRFAKRATARGGNPAAHGRGAYG
jgi:hypothetical protein